MYFIQETCRITFSLYRQYSGTAASNEDFTRAGMILTVGWIPLAEV